MAAPEGVDATRAADERRARLLAEREDRRARAQARNDPLPEGVTLVRLSSRVAAVRVGVGRVELQTERDGAFRPLRVSDVHRGRLRRARVVVLDAELGRLAMRCYLHGEQGIADVGQREVNAMADLGNDPISAVIAFVFIVGFVFASPYLAVRYRRRAARARAFAEELRTAAGLT